MTSCFPAFSRQSGEYFCKDKQELERARLECIIICCIYNCSLTFMSIALCRYWTFLDSDVVIDNISNDSISHNSTQNETTISCHAHDVLFIRIYLVGVNAIVALNLPLLLLMIYYSAQGSITDTKARRFVAPLLYMK